MNINLNIQINIIYFIYFIYFIYTQMNIKKQLKIIILRQTLELLRIIALRENLDYNSLVEKYLKL